MESDAEIQQPTNSNEVNRRNFSAKEKLKFNDTIIEINYNKPSKINDLNDDQQKQAKVLKRKYDRKLKDYFFEIEVASKVTDREKMKLGRNELVKDFPLALLEFYEKQLKLKY